MKRNFITGDNWLYYKFYSGQKTSDLILKEIIKPVTTKLIDCGIISSWFYIRYADPKTHLRCRFFINNTDNISVVINEIFEACYPFVDAGQINRIQTDTYKRELERYGKNTIELSELIFWHDSEMIVDLLEIIDIHGDENVRWLFAMKAIDRMLNDFGFTLHDKFELLDYLAQIFGKEFNIDSSLIIQLSNKYRKEKRDIFEFMKMPENINHTCFPAIKLLNRKSENIKSTVNKILEIKSGGKLEMRFNDLIGSYIHMMMNRLFRSRQRLHEMVIYGFLYRFYRSELAREKYN